MKHTMVAAMICATLTAGAAAAENVEIYLVDMLDNLQNGYCLDIARAQGAAANPEDGLQGHTCYSPLGELMVDQIFDTEMFAQGVLYMPEFDVCAEVASVDAGSAVGLAACDGSDAQAFEFSGEGRISPAMALDMCLTVGTDTRGGRSDANQIKTLSLQACATDQDAYQLWATRTE